MRYRNGGAWRRAPSAEPLNKSESRNMLQLPAPDGSTFFNGGRRYPDFRHVRRPCKRPGVWDRLALGGLGSGLGPPTGRPHPSGSILLNRTRDWKAGSYDEESSS